MYHESQQPTTNEDKEDVMKSTFTNLVLSLTLACCLASPAALAVQSEKQSKPESPHATAVKACNTAYNDAVKKANDDYAAASKEAKMKKGKERTDAMKAASTARSDALAAAKKTKKDCIAAAPK